MSYPPEPWDLAGTGHLTTWRVPVDALPRLPFRARPVVVRGQAIVSTAWVAYSEDGLMAYNELLAAVVVRGRAGIGLSITDIWVDDATSMEGGRALWGIPKELATFDGLSATTGAGPTTGPTAGPTTGPIASAVFRPRRHPAVPLPLPLRSKVIQTLNERTVASAIRASGRLRSASSSWTFAPEGPLSWLNAGRPVTSLVADDFRMRFGS